jgi:hypothetical protein
MSSARKYSSVHTAPDVWNALAELEGEARALIALSVRPSVTNPAVVIVVVSFRDVEDGRDGTPVFSWQETLARGRRIDMASYLHRVLWDAFEAYHNSPWHWTRRLRKHYATPT